MKFAQEILELLVGVEQPGPDGAFGDAENPGDIGMGHSLDIEHGHHGPVVRGELLHRFVEPDLEFFEVCFPDGGRSGSQFEELLVVLDLRIDIIQTQLEPAAPFFEVVNRHVDGNRMHPSRETGSTPESAEGPVGFGPDVLEQIVGVLVVGGHVIHEAVQFRAVFEHQLVECGGIAALGAIHPCVVFFPG